VGPRSIRGLVTQEIGQWVEKWVNVQEIGQSVEMWVSGSKVQSSGSRSGSVVIGIRYRFSPQKKSY
jgi:head-tail adaptor